MTAPWSAVASFACGLGLAALVGVGVGLAAWGLDYDAEGPEPRDRIQLYVPGENAWEMGGRLPEGRELPTLLPVGDGRVLIVGGESYGEATASRAFLWSEKTRTLEPIGLSPRGKCTQAVPLGGAKVAVFVASYASGVEGAVLDLGSRQWTPIALRPDAQLVGAAAAGRGDAVVVTQTSAWLWHSGSGETSPLGLPLAPGRDGGAAAKPYLYAGCLRSVQLPGERTLFVSERWYDPERDGFALLWTPGGGLTSPASLGEGLLDAKDTAIVLAIGARKDGGVTLVLTDRVVVAPPDLGKTARVALPGEYTAATVLASESVLLTNAERDPAEGLLFDPGTQTGRATGPLADSRYDYAQLELEDGRVLLVGGSARVRSRGPAWLGCAAAAIAVAGAWGAFLSAVARGARRRVVVAGAVALVAAAGAVAAWVATWGSIIKG